MKFIHTADWHLGNRMHEVDRKAESQFFLRWLKEQIVLQEAETLVIAGDIYDVINPSSEAENLYYSFLASLSGTCCRNIIIVGGNHDSGAKLDSSKELLEAMNIHVVGSVANKSVENLVFELKDKSGETAAVCAAVPFVRESEFQPYYQNQSEDGSFEDKAYTALYKKVLEQAEALRNGRNIPIIATGHLYAANLEGRRAEADQNERCDDGIKSIDPVGNLGAVTVEAFPKEFDYVALGHIHYTTMVAKNPKVRYSGSPFVMGFDEASIKRQVLCVELGGHSDGSLKVTPVEIPQSVTYKRISGTCDEIKKQLSDLQKKPADKPVYLEIEYRRNFQIDIHQELEPQLALLEKSGYVAISWKPMKTDSSSEHKSHSTDLDMDQMQNISDAEVFEALIRAKTPDLTDEEKDEAVKKFLPLFLEVAASVQAGEE